MKASVLKSIIYWLINLEIHIMILVLASKVIGECHKMVKEQECIVAPNAFCVNMSQWFSKKTSLYKNTYASPICSPISVGTLVTLVGFANQLYFSNLKKSVSKTMLPINVHKIKMFKFLFQRNIKINSFISVKWKIEENITGMMETIKSINSIVGLVIFDLTSTSLILYLSFCSFLRFCQHRFSHLYNRDNNSAYLIRV